MNYTTPGKNALLYSIGTIGFVTGFVRDDEKRILLQLIGRPRELRSVQDV